MFWNVCEEKTHKGCFAKLSNHDASPDLGVDARICATLARRAVAVGFPARVARFPGRGSPGCSAKGNGETVTERASPSRRRQKRESRSTLISQAPQFCQPLAAEDKSLTNRAASNTSRRTRQTKGFHFCPERLSTDFSKMLPRHHLCVTFLWPGEGGEGLLRSFPDRVGIQSQPLLLLIVKALCGFSLRPVVDRQKHSL